jgi:hypothetical protein
MSTPSNSSSSTEASSDRVRLRRHAERGSYDSATVLEILDEALISHVGVPTADGPIVLPMLHANDGETLYLHGAAANHLLKSGENTEICVTATLVDGLVIARSAFHHSMNYRSVVVRGRALVVLCSVGRAGDRRSRQRGGARHRDADGQWRQYRSQLRAGRGRPDR